MLHVIKHTKPRVVYPGSHSEKQDNQRLSMSMRYDALNVSPGARLLTC